MSDNRDQAKNLLLHYLRMIGNVALTSAGITTKRFQFSSDNEVEIREIVDRIIDAAVQEAVSQVNAPIERALVGQRAEGSKRGDLFCAKCYSRRVVEIQGEERVICRDCCEESDFEDMEKGGDCAKI